jgi:hypothetical protein
VLSLTGHEAGESTYVCAFSTLERVADPVFGKPRSRARATPPPCAPRGAATVSATMWSIDLSEMCFFRVFCVDVCVYACIAVSFEQVV